MLRIYLSSADKRRLHGSSDIAANLLNKARIARDVGDCVHALIRIARFNCIRHHNSLQLLRSFVLGEMATSG